MGAMCGRKMCHMIAAIELLHVATGNSNYRPFLNDAIKMGGALIKYYSRYPRELLE